jgi:ketosteroid isomerase-like protein
MEAELAILLSDIDGGGSALAARRLELEEAISDAKTAAEFSVRRAQSEFYSAFSSADLDAMHEVWSREVHVRCVHPGMASLEGREEVMRSWAQIFLSPAFVIEPSRSQIEICGRTAVCSCIEETPGGGRLEALNLYRREGGNWRMTLHMASPVVQQIVEKPGL